jgi:hypothetical protein
MQTRARSVYSTIRSEGGLLPPDLLQRVAANDAGLPGLKPQDYHLDRSERINEAVNRSWARLTALWRTFSAQRASLPISDPATTITRERWLLPLLDELGYGRVSTANAVEINGKSYAISHRWQTVPLHLVGCNIPLDIATRGVAGASRSNPHSLLQDYLNLTPESQWGLLTNGLALRLLRDNATLTRQAYLEFDLESMFEGEQYADFVLLWLICHQSRFETLPDGDECLLESWSKAARDQGTRALDDLRAGVEEAIKTLGSGLLLHPANTTLKTRLRANDLSALDYYRQLLRMVYRLIFLFVAEDRDLLSVPNATTQQKQRFLRFYSTARLRAMAMRQRGSQHHDLYEGLRQVFSLLSGAAIPGKTAPDDLRLALGLPALGGFLFNPSFTPDLNGAQLSNLHFLTLIRSLSTIVQGTLRRSVDYRNLGSEELGSVYESLLELHPYFDMQSGAFTLVSVAGNERKTTGSYYTPISLINELLNTALDPVITQALEKGRRLANNQFTPANADAERAWARAVLLRLPNPQASTLKEQESALQQQAVLDLKIIDPAAGSGHFLIAAARRLARALSLLRAGGDEPSPAATRTALRDVIRECIYGVDINPMSVELCKVNLWLESIEPGKPLSFLDAHIQCGNSLIGLGPLQDLKTISIPDDAFNPVTGDDKAVSRSLKARNKEESHGQLGLRITLIENLDDLKKYLADRDKDVQQMPEETAEEVLAKSQARERYLADDGYQLEKLSADLYTSAFFWPLKASRNVTIMAPTNGQLRRARAGQALDAGLRQQVEGIAGRVGFFHWPLAFPNVFAAGGFDCILGNPPWERIKLQEEEFFAQRDPKIATALNKAVRAILIKALQKENPALSEEFEHAKHQADCESKFLRISERFPLSAVGDLNTYPLFAEQFRDLMGENGRAGIIVPTGIATDNNTSGFFGDLVTKRQIASLFDFENREKVFPAVDSRYKFSLLSLSKKPTNNPDFLFFATRVDHLRDPLRRFKLSPEEISLFNPNTKTMPIFRTRADAELTRMVYSRLPVLVNEQTGENPWGVRFQRMFDMSNDSHLFITEPREGYLPLYEGKMFWLYDHRLSTFDGKDTRDVTLAEKQSQIFTVRPRYWIPRDEFQIRQNNIEKCGKWYFGFRNISNNTNERTFIISIVPKTGVGNNAPVIMIGEKFSSEHATLLLSSLSALPFDYITRQKLGGVTMNFFYVEQIAVMTKKMFSFPNSLFISNRVIELIYTSNDLNFVGHDFLEEIGESDWNIRFPHNQFRNNILEPFQFDSDRRAVLQGELDAYFAALYGFNHKQLRFILDPADLTPAEIADIMDPWEEVTDALDPAGYVQRAAASTFPGETFRVLKNNEMRQYGEYRTRRLVLEAWDRLTASGELPGAVAPYKPVSGNGRMASGEQGVVNGDKRVASGGKALANSQQRMANGGRDLVNGEQEIAIGEQRIANGEVPLTTRRSLDPQPLAAPHSPPAENSAPPSPLPTHSSPEVQQSFTDFGLYKCLTCGKLEMGFNRPKHITSLHPGQSVEWFKIGK